MCQYPVHQVNVSRKGVSCAPHSSKFFETPCILRLGSTAVLGIYQTPSVIPHWQFSRYKLNNVLCLAVADYCRSQKQLIEIAVHLPNGFCCMTLIVCLTVVYRGNGNDFYTPLRKVNMKSRRSQLSQGCNWMQLPNSAK